MKKSAPHTLTIATILRLDLITSAHSLFKAVRLLRRECNRSIEYEHKPKIYKNLERCSIIVLASTLCVAWSRIGIIIHHHPIGRAGSLTMVRRQSCRIGCEEFARMRR